MDYNVDCGQAVAILPVRLGYPYTWSYGTLNGIAANWLHSKDLIYDWCAVNQVAAYLCQPDIIKDEMIWLVPNDEQRLLFTLRWAT